MATKEAKIPDRIKEQLSPPAQKVWLKAYKQAKDKFSADEKKAQEVAWRALKQAGYKKVGDQYVKKSDDFHAYGEIAKIDHEEQIVFGWAYVQKMKDGQPVDDVSGKNVSIHEIEKAAYPYVLSSRAGGEMHVVQVSKLVESVVFTPEKIAKMGLPEGSVPWGWWVGYKIEDADAWEGVKTGRLKMFSIGGSGRERAAKRSEETELTASVIAAVVKRIGEAEEYSDLVDIDRRYLLLQTEIVKNFGGAEEFGDFYPFEKQHPEVVEVLKASRHGPSIKCPAIYEALRREGKTKTQAAKISNGCHEDPDCRCH